MGILEGEGWFGTIISNINKGYRYLYPVVEIQMVDRDIICRVAKYLGSRYYAYDDLPSGKIRYKTCVVCAKAGKWFTKLYPLLGKRRQAQIRKALRMIRESRGTNYKSV